jgi:hypothetical protein
MDENKQLTEEQLVKAAGGWAKEGGCRKNCKYMWAQKTIIDKDGIERRWCYGDDVLGLDCLDCVCRGTSRCVDRFHTNF